MCPLGRRSIEPGFTLFVAGSAVVSLVPVRFPVPLQKWPNHNNWSDVCIYTQINSHNYDDTVLSPGQMIR